MTATKKTSKKTETESKKSESKKSESESESKTLKVARKDAVSLLKTFGFKETHKYTNDLLVKRLNKMEQYKESFDGTLDGDTEELVAKVIKAQGNITVVGEEPKGTKKADDKKEKKEKKAPKEKKAAAQTDVFGRRENTQGWNIDKVILSSKNAEVTTKDLANTTKLPARRIVQHMVWMVRMGFAKKTDKGYKVEKKTA